MHYFDGNQQGKVIVIRPPRLRFDLTWQRNGMNGGDVFWSPINVQNEIFVNGDVAFLPNAIIFAQREKSTNQTVLTSSHLGMAG